MPVKPGWSVAVEDGLVMRGAVPDDADRLADYNAGMHREPGEDEPSAAIRAWTSDLLTKPHPRTSLDDIIVVEDTASGEIVSSTIYFTQTWSYCGIPLLAGQPEIVSTHPDYRNRGLVRKQFDLMHRWGDERGHLVQGIEGIPYYYRQFDYEMALEMAVQRSAAISELPGWKADEERAVRLRKATRADVPLMLRLRETAKERALFTPHLTETELEYQLFDRAEKSALSLSPWVIEDSNGAPVGFTAIKLVPALGVVELTVLEFERPSHFRTYTEPFLKSLRALAESLPQEGDKPLTQITVVLPTTHPAQPFLGRRFTQTVRPGGPYTWYIRTPNLPKLLMQIAPKLEERLNGTSFDGLTGEKVIGFYRSGLKLTFADGQLTAVDTVRMPDRRQTMVNLPDLTFLQVLCGRKSFIEIATMFADAGSSSDSDIALIDTLFPKQASDMALAIG